jgi:hypothetical protein
MTYMMRFEIEFHELKRIVTVLKVEVLENVKTKR